jgi:uncharacterized membrane protein
VSDGRGIDNEGPHWDLDPHTGGLCAYLVGWVSGLVVFFTQTDREVRFHAAQSVIVFGGLFTFLLLWTMIMNGALGGGLVGRLLFALSVLLIWGLSIALWGFMCFQGRTLTHFRLPIAGRLAERWEARQPPVRG